MTHAPVQSTSPRPNGLLRFGLRFPIWLYRLHLGGLMGDGFLLLHHIGRKSGRAHETVLQIVRHTQPDSDGWVVLSGWGNQSDWLRNLQQTPDVCITLGNRTLKVYAIIFTESAAAGELLDYSRHRDAGHRSKYARQPRDCSELAKIIPLVAFHPQPKGALI